MKIKAERERALEVLSRYPDMYDDFTYTMDSFGPGDEDSLAQIIYDLTKVITSLEEALGEYR